MIDLIKIKAQLQRVLACNYLVGINGTLEVSNVEMAQGSTYFCWKLNVFLVYLGDESALVSSQIISDRFTGKDCEDVSGEFNVDYLQYEVNYLYWSGSLCFKIKRRHIPHFYFVFTTSHQVSWTVFDDFLYFSWMNGRLSDQNSAGKLPNIKTSIDSSCEENIFIFADEEVTYHFDSADFIDRFLAICTPYVYKGLVVKSCDKLIRVGVISQSFSYRWLGVVFSLDSSSFWVKQEYLFRLLGCY